MFRALISSLSHLDRPRCVRHPSVPAPDWRGPVASPEQQLNSQLGQRCQQLRSMQQCDFLRGFWDGLVGAPERCQFDPASTVDRLFQPAPAATPLGVVDIPRGTTFEHDRYRAQVDPQGNVDLNLSPAATNPPVKRTSCASTSTSGAAGHEKIRVQGGQIYLPNGKTLPFGNRGVILVMPDGTQMAVGRANDNSNEQVRTVMAGPGQEIPTNPPGKTQVLTFNANWDIVAQMTK